jgi:alpha-D-xyloside xylohydrolase
VWKATVGKPQRLTLLTAAGASPKTDALGAMPEAAFPISRDEIVGRLANGKIALRMPLALDEDVYGLGVDFRAMRRNGSAFQLHVDHWGGRTGRTHAPVPFYVSSNGYGVFIDAARYINLNVGVSVRLAAPTKPPVIDRTTGKGTWSSSPRSDSIEALIPAEGVDVYVVAGPSPMDAVRRYNLFNGGGALPPKWGLGFMTRTPTAYSAADALNEVAEFRKRGIPLDMLGLEPGWHDHAYPTSFEWDKYRSVNRRTFGQVRGTNGGSSSFPFVIYNDNYAFDEYITAVGNSAFAGVLWSPEVRGGEGEDMLRRVQAVCFSPLALFNGWATATKLWTHAGVAGDIRDAIKLRMRLLPYF